MYFSSNDDFPTPAYLSYYLPDDPISKILKVSWPSDFEFISDSIYYLGNYNYIDQGPRVLHHFLTYYIIPKS